MTKIKLCGLSRQCDIEIVNTLIPEYIGFVFSPKSRRYIAPDQAAELKRLLAPEIKAVGVFVRENPEIAAKFLNEGIIDIAQLHGGESEEYIGHLRVLTDKPIIKAFSINTVEDIAAAECCSADYVLLDSGNGGTGTAFNWSLIKHMTRPYFLAGGLRTDNVEHAVNMLRPYAVDVSSGIETNGIKVNIKWRTLFPLSERKKENDESEWTLWHSRRSVYTGNADECSH